MADAGQSYFLIHPDSEDLGGNGMSKYLAVAVLLSILLPQTLRAEGVTLGFADLQKINQDSPAIQSIQKQSKDLIDEYNKFAAEQDALLAKASPEQRKNIEDQLAERQKRLEIGKKINDQKRKAYEERIRQTIKEVAKERKLSLVLFSQDGILLLSDYADITDAVLQRINDGQR